MKNDYIEFVASTPAAEAAVRTAIDSEVKARGALKSLEQDLKLIGAAKLAVIGNDAGVAAVAFNGKAPDGWVRVQSPNLKAPVPFFRPPADSEMDARFKACSASYQIEGLPRRFFIAKDGETTMVRVAQAKQDGKTFVLRVPRASGISMLPGFIARQERENMNRGGMRAGPRVA